VRWRNNSSQTYLFGVNDSYEVILAQEGPQMFIHQSLARTLRLHDAVIELLEQEDGSESFELAGIYIACYKLLDSFCRGNDENKAVLCSSRFISLVSKHMGHSFGPLKTLATVITYNGFYKTTPTQLLQKIADLTQESLETESRADAPMYVDLLTHVLPDPSFAVEHDDLALLQQTQLLVIQAVARIPIIEQCLKSTADRFPIPPSDPVMLKLAGLLVRCIGKRANTDQVRLDVLSKYPALERRNLAAVLMQVDETVFGYKPRANALSPWLELLELMHLDFPATGKGTTNVLESMTDVIEDILRPDLQLYVTDFAAGEKSENLKTYSIESTHPYADNLDLYWEVDVPSAKRVKIAFSQQSKTENTHDYVRILKAQPRLPDGNLRFRVKIDSGAALRTSMALDSHELGKVPSGTLVTINANSRKWFHEEQHDPERTHPDGFYRVEVLDPPQYRGWISQKHHILQPVDLNGEDWQKVWSPNYSGTAFPGTNGTPPLVIFESSFVVYFHRYVSCCLCLTHC
jgi:hypothetical protein